LTSEKKRYHQMKLFSKINSEVIEERMRKMEVENVIK
jgi:hypothetical protein